MYTHLKRILDFLLASLVYRIHNGTRNQKRSYNCRDQNYTPHFSVFMMLLRLIIEKVQCSDRI